jgi:peptide/nickel transport system substrate-binding protein
MTVSQKRTTRLSVLALVIACAVFSAAFLAGGGSAQSQSSSAKSKRFGELRVVLDTIDFLDPAQAYTGQSWAAMWDVYQTLLTYEHVAGAGGYKLVPGLAESMPKISADKKVYSFKLRAGLRYSDGKPVLASDFKSTIKRDFLATSPGVGFYEGIAGATEFEKKQANDIAGIVTNNKRRTIVIRLTAPRGDFLTIIALLFSAPVPTGTPPEDQSTNPIPGTGPYQIASYEPNRGFTLVRNKYFKATKATPAGNPDKITFSLVGDANAAVQRVIGGSADYTNAAIPAERIADAQGKGQLRLRAAANTYYFWMNTQVPPFNDVRVRRAVNYAIDRAAMVKTVWGGLGRPTQNVLPSTYPSYRKLNLYPHDVAKARALIKQAGVDGTKVTVWGRQVSDSVTATELYASYLEQIGFKTELKILPRSTYYTTIGNADTKAQTGWARWLEDYPHPLDWFDVLLNGNRITPTDNNNFAWYNNAKTNGMIEQLKSAPVLDGPVNNKWAQTEKLIMQQAPWAPWSNRVFPEFFSKGMGCIVMQALYGVDFLRICKK